jgi:hypothetical protein
MKDKFVKIFTETCLAFFQNVYVGFPGAGKILFARALPNSTSELRIEESLDVVSIYANVDVFSD